MALSSKYLKENNFNPKKQKRQTSSKLKKNGVGRCTDSSQDTLKHSDKLQPNNDSRMVLML
jgi:hypothetical protein